MIFITRTLSQVGDSPCQSAHNISAAARRITPDRSGMWESKEHLHPPAAPVPPWRMLPGCRGQALLRPCPPRRLAGAAPMHRSFPGLCREHPGRARDAAHGRGMANLVQRVALSQLLRHVLNIPPVGLAMAWAVILILLTFLEC